MSDLFSYEIEPELRGSAPRPVRVNTLVWLGAGALLLAALVAAVVVGTTARGYLWVLLYFGFALCVAVVLLGLRAREQWRLLRDGAAASGTISAHGWARPYGMRVYHFVHYRFTAGGQTYEQSTAIPEQNGKSPAVGDPVTVLYDARNPARSRLYRSLDFVEMVKS